jgi:signal transduction histidine kinase
MRRRSLTVRLIVPALLVVLVGALAILQYRWLTQVSNAERDRRQAWLRQHAEQFASDFDSEISRLYLTLQNQAGSLLANETESFARVYDTWRERARFPQMLRALYVVDASGQPGSDGPTIRQFRPDQRAFADVSWPAELARIRESMTQTTPPARSEGARGVMYLQAPIAADIPALVVSVPSMRTLPAGEARSMITVGIGHSYLVAELDRGVITTTILPALMAQHFPDDHAADAYRVEILDKTRNNAVIASKNVADASPIDQARADASVPMFSLRLDQLTQVVARTDRTTPAMVTPLPRPTLAPPLGAGTAATLAAAVAAGAARGQTFQFYVESSRGGRADVVKTTGFGAPAWQLVLQHSAGSLDAAVTQVRRRNLWVSFGILAVLASGIGLVVVNSQRAQRLAAQQMDFVATVSHELRTPVAVIRSAAQNLSAGVVHDAAQAKKYGDLIEDEGRRLTRTVDQVLEYAGLTAATRTAWPPADVGAVVRDLAAAHEAKFRAAGVDVHVDIERDLPPVAIDADGLQRALDNLLANAIKYGADGRWLLITAKSAIVRRRAEVQLSVSDHGRGIDAADLPHIFEPFYRGRHAIDRQIDGSGLGLSLVKRIAEMRGGSVTVESTKDQGSTFTLHLPVVHDVATTMAVREEPHPRQT